ncbi:outer membrane protein assembly factor BamA [Thiohalomonas denitrificans]|uniref:Outer membrane protein assembly factor BamA n=1 Tax=Thiohalomonas denitrificans TaxID=415747 RepID=A0A1G5Q3G5_9GAMM|nr:outer membrane protein assembly factor BamA [Thiohalomonas denitrificans]SCZ55839.1 Beta-barrel assembly machine subunit BamA [Thiohalomonas denitrificans]
MAFPKSIRRSAAALVLFASIQSAWSFEPFVVEEIQVEGLQRISVGTVFNYLPVEQGERLTEDRSSDAIRALFRTGFFENVVLEREGDTLIVFVEERPAIASIDLEGNDDIPSEQLLESLQQIGFAEGRVFNPSMLDRVEQELKRQYLNLGKYSARVESEVTPLERNRVAVNILVGEGEAAKIKRINIVGNSLFDEDELLDEFELGTKPFFSWFSDRDQYSKQRLGADLETLRSWYLNRGYINFSVDSTQVSITPDKQDVYITINISEGEQFRIGELALGGDTVLPEQQMQELIEVGEGEVFSRTRVNQSARGISERLGDEGYAFANVNPIPDIDEEQKTVDLTFFVDPGKRVYVRRINISGNVKTRDEVLRRELRQMESAPISTQSVERSRERMDRLGFFEQVEVETPVVPGSPDLVDVNYKVVERPNFGSLNLGIGYGESDGLLLSGSINQDNFLGTGDRVAIEVNTSDVNTVYSISHTNPYFTDDGISRTLRASYRETDAEEADISEYTTDSYGAGVSFGVPLSEFSFYRLGLDYRVTDMQLGTDASDEIIGFCEDNAEIDDCRFSTVTLSPSWNRDTRNKTVFPDRGGVSTLSGELAVAAGDNGIGFFKARAKHEQYIPLNDWLIFKGEAEIGYGDGLGDTTELPPFESFYAGGSRTVRGYRANSLGPRDSNDDPLGGNARVLGNAELIFPSPFGEQADSTRLSAFVDAGNVYDTADSDIDFGELRYSAGLSLVWLTPMGPMSFSLSQPMNEQADDETEVFQFTLGTLF